MSMNEFSSNSLEHKKTPTRWFISPLIKTVHVLNAITEQSFSLILDGIKPVVYLVTVVLKTEFSFK